MEQITKISQVKEMLSISSANIQESISGSRLEFETKQVLDSMAQETHYVLSAIIEYLENN